MKWSIQVNYDAHDSKDDKPIRARAIYWTEAPDVRSAYDVAEASFKDRKNVKFGAAIPGHHVRF